MDLIIEILNAAERDGTPLDEAIETHAKICDFGRKLDVAIGGLKRSCELLDSLRGVADRAAIAAAITNSGFSRDSLAEADWITHAVWANALAAEKIGLPGVASIMKTRVEEMCGLLDEIDPYVEGRDRAAST